MPKVFKGKVVLVIPVFNEEANIGRVLPPAVEARGKGIVDEIIVVNDGSRDRTAEIAKSYPGVKVIDSDPSGRKKNKGKGMALFRGFEEAHSRGAVAVVTADADLLNLEAEHFNQILRELGREGVRMAVARAHEKIGRGAFGPIDSLSGERAVKMKYLNPVFENPERYVGIRKALQESRFGIESAVNFLLSQEKGFPVHVENRGWIKFFDTVPFLCSEKPFRKEGSDRQKVSAEIALSRIDMEKKKAEAGLTGILGERINQMLGKRRRR